MAFQAQPKEFEEKVISIDRVARVVKGGRRFRFRATVVIGDGKGRVGLGIGKGGEVMTSIAKAVARARRNMITIPLKNGTIPHEITVRFSGAQVMLKPASAGTGVIAGGAVRAVLECAGVHDVLSKSLGSDNAINVVHATVAALKGLVRPEEIAARRGLPLEDVAPAALLRARAGVGA
jgi:small subunit ribosomal protein S5